MSIDVSMSGKKKVKFSGLKCVNSLILYILYMLLSATLRLLSRCFRAAHKSIKGWKNESCAK